MTTQGFRECSSQITNSINTRIYDRNIPSQMLQPYLSVRPVMTKYSIMPIVDPRTPITAPLTVQPIYNVHDVFNPGNAQAPWSGFATNINTESELRNQIYALQKCSQAVYVPNSNSDLYNYSFKTNMSEGNNYNQHNLLFKQENFDSFNPNPDPNVVGSYMFSNPTRAQVKDLA
jgi:hypothetical protein